MTFITTDQTLFEINRQVVKIAFIFSSAVKN